MSISEYLLEKITLCYVSAGQISSNRNLVLKTIQDVQACTSFSILLVATPFNKKFYLKEFVNDDKIKVVTPHTLRNMKSTISSLENGFVVLETFSGLKNRNNTYKAIMKKVSECTLFLLITDYVEMEAINHAITSKKEGGKVFRDLVHRRESNDDVQFEQFRGKVILEDVGRMYIDTNLEYFSHFKSFSTELEQSFRQAIQSQQDAAYNAALLADQEAGRLEKEASACLEKTETIEEKPKPTIEELRNLRLESIAKRSRDRSLKI